MPVTVRRAPGLAASHAITLAYWRNGSLPRANKKTNKMKGAPGIDVKRGRWRYRFQVHGQPRVVVVTGLEATRENLGAARKLRDAHRLRVQFGEPDPIEHVPFSEAVGRYLVHKEAKHRDKPATAKRIATSLTSWKEFMGKRAISTWKRGDVLDYLTWRRETGRLEVTVRKDFLAGRQCAQFAIDHGWLESDPFVGIEVPSDRDSRNELVLTRDEVDSYLTYADKHHALGDLARLMLNQGIRPDCEGLQIRAEDVDLERGLLEIRNSKTRAGKRTLRLTEESKRILARRIANSPGSWVFSRRADDGRTRPGGLDQPLTYSGLIGVHERVLGMAEGTVPLFGLYALRHTFATWFYDATKDLVALKEVLGHSDLRTVLRYVNDRQPRMDRAMELFDRGISGLTEPGK